MALQERVAEENKINEIDLEVLACAGKDVGLAEVMKKTGLTEDEVTGALKRAAALMPMYRDRLLEQANDADLPVSHRQMAAQASQSVSTVISWVRQLQTTSSASQTQRIAA